MRKHVYNVLMVCGLGVLLSGCGENPRVAEVEALVGDPATGEPLYRANCLGCHGPDGQGAHSMYPGGELSDDLIETILEGLSGMPSFERLTNQEIADLVAYIRTFD